MTRQSTMSVLQVSKYIPNFTRESHGNLCLFYHGLEKSQKIGVVQIVCLTKPRREGSVAEFYEQRAKRERMGFQCEEDRHELCQASNMYFSKMRNDENEKRS